jgi:hypothetical protein
VSYARPAGPELPAPPGWPDPPAPAVWQGLAGQIVEAVAPHTEADPIAILAQLLVAAGAVVGRGAWVAVEATRHHPNQFAVIVGESAKARKGSSWDQVAALMTKADPSFPARTSTGLSSGEGLIWALRDPSGADPGAKDPRLLVVEAEFASVLKAIARDINTLSPVLRSAWDGRPLALLTRTAPARASNPHLAVIGHITAAIPPFGVSTAYGVSLWDSTWTSSTTTRRHAVWSSRTASKTSWCRGRPSGSRAWASRIGRPASTPRLLAKSC